MPRRYAAIINKRTSRYHRTIFLIDVDELDRFHKIRPDWAKNGTFCSLWVVNYYAFMEIMGFALLSLVVVVGFN